MNQRIRLSRRDLLKGAAAAALAGPYVLSSHAWGAGAVPAPSNRLTLAHIGIGNQGSGHFGSMLSNPAAQILAVCDVRQYEVREKRQKEVDERYAKDRENGTYKGCAGYNDFRECLARPDIDAVVIAVPDHWHAIISIAAAKAGKDIYCEKPLSLTVREAWAMVAATRRYGRVFQTGSQQRSDQKFRFACELVRNGRIGTLKEVHVNIGDPSEERYYPEEPVPAGMDWNLWLGPAPWNPYNGERCSGNYGGGWRRVRDYSGGMTTDWGAHHFDIAQWGMGMDGSGPVEVFPPGTLRPGMAFKYANGVILWRDKAANGVLFEGDKGKVEVNRGYLRTYPDEIGKVPIGPNETRLYESKDHRADWMECIKTRRRPICDVEIGASSVTVCHLGNIAYWLNRSFKYDPAKREIVGDDEAARWLDRPKRAPWRTEMV